MNLDLTNRNALVCGSTQGIGKATAKQLAEMGANITLVARNKEKLQAVLSELDTNKGQNHNYIIADLQNPTDLGAKINKANQIFHILINNTGGPAGGPVFSASLDQFESAFTQHLKCNHILAQAVVPGMKEECFGRIINIISTSVKQPLAGLGVSNTIRGAVANWSKTLAGELGAFGITVNNVLPGATATERLSEIINNKATKSGKSFEEVSATMKAQVPANRFAQPEEIANAIAFLASEASSYINGINVPVDGGRTKSL
jgi:3-oxoacyl-[acyl-carrier protein] reductase